MFGSIGVPELVIVLVIALLIFGPRRLPEIGRSLARTIAEYKRATTEVHDAVEDEIRIEERQVAEASSPPASDEAARQGTSI
jgi:sec-independent protein translocase protein TatA